MVLNYLFFFANNTFSSLYNILRSLEKKTDNSWDIYLLNEQHNICLSDTDYLENGYNDFDEIHVIWGLEADQTI